MEFKGKMQHCWKDFKYQNTVLIKYYSILIKRKTLNILRI